MLNILKNLKKQSLVEQTSNLVDQINTTHKIEPILVDITLRQGERCYFYEDETDFAEETKARQSRGAGVSFRVMRGVWYHTGGSTARYVPEIKKQDQGKLYLTNQRIIFVGKFESRVFDLQKVLSVKDYIDAIEIYGVSKKNPYFFVKNPFDWKLILNILISGANLNKLPNISLEVK